MNGVTLISETANPDGSYAAMVNVYGAEYAIHYVAGEVRVYATREMNAASWKTKKNPALAKRFVAARIAALGPEFAAEHAKLYKEPCNVS